MNTLQELNNFGNTGITYTDNRPYGVIFDKSVDSNLDRTITIEDKIFDVVPSINIEEIIDAASAQVEYEIELPTSEATLAWDSLPSGVTLITVGNRYILRYLSSVSDWNAVKDPTITISDDFFGTFFYTIRIRYQTPSGQQTIRAIIGGELPLSDMVSVASISTIPTHVKGLQSSILGLFGIDIDLAFEGNGLLVGPFSLNAELTYYRAGAASLQNAVSTITTLPTTIFNSGPLSYNTSATIRIKGDKLASFNNSVTRTVSNGNAEIVAADAGRLVFGHDATATNPSNVGEILCANNIIELDAIDNETVTTIGGTSTFSDLTAIDISGNHLVIAKSPNVGFDWGNSIDKDYLNSSVSPNVSITTGFTQIGDVAATPEYFIVSDIGYNSGQGRIYVYSKDNNGNSPYSVTEEYTITVTNSNNLGFNVSANANYIVATEGGTSNKIHVFDISDGSLIRSITGAIDRPRNIDLYDKYVIIGSAFQNNDYDKGAYIYDVSTGNLHQTIATSGQLDSVAISRLFYATADAVNDEIKIYNRETNALWKTLSNIDTSVANLGNKIAIDDEFLIAADRNTGNVTMFYGSIDGTTNTFIRTAESSSNTNFTLTVDATIVTPPIRSLFTFDENQNDLTINSTTGVTGTIRTTISNGYGNPIGSAANNYAGIAYNNSLSQSMIVERTSGDYNTNIDNNNFILDFYINPYGNTSGFNRLIKFHNSSNNFELGYTYDRDFGVNNDERFNFILRANSSDVDTYNYTVTVGTNNYYNAYYGWMYFRIEVIDGNMSIKMRDIENLGSITTIISDTNYNIDFNSGYTIFGSGTAPTLVDLISLQIEDNNSNLYTDVEPDYETWYDL